MTISVALFCSTVDTSQPPSNAENILALSGMFIFSTPTAKATSQLPPRSAMVARLNADEPDAQAFSTVNTGMPSMPRRRIAIGPGIAVWPWNCPLVSVA